MKDTERGGLSGTASDSKTFNFTGSDKAFSVSNFIKQNSHLQELVATQVIGMTRPAQVQKCAYCLVCKQHRAVSKMSSVMVICRECLRGWQATEKRARDNRAERLALSLKSFLRARLTGVL